MEREEEIRTIAYGLWVREGRPRGGAIQRWLQAEAIWNNLHNQSAFNEITRPDLVNEITETEGGDNDESLFLVHS
jgi:hypothetical protein